ncbi:MAG: hypothetical protein QOG80_1251 [Pseudonocardiales bacterium]|jgi:hypothetical protein|nr:hypothetical protein [Pseudonocardiales bacterium]
MVVETAVAIPAPARPEDQRGLRRRSHLDRVGVATRALLSLKATPLAMGLMLALLLSAVLLDTHPADIDGVVAWASTNLHNLARHPVAAMIASVFVVPGLPSVQIVIVAVTCVALERRLGTGRTVLIALSGQVLATLLTEYGADLGAQWHLWATSSPNRPDVGVSYLMFSLLAASWLLVEGWARVLGLVVTAAWAASMVATSPGMTSTGHVLSIVFGVATMVLVRRHSRAGSIGPVSSRRVARAAVLGRRAPGAARPACARR